MDRRYRWRIGILGSAVILGAIGWTWWNTEAGARLRIVLRDVEAMGLPMRIEDIRPAPVPDGENAAPLLNQAFLLMAGGKTEPGALLPALKELEAFWKKDPREDFSAQDVAALKAKLDMPEIREIQSLLHRAAGRPGCNFGLDYSKGAGLPLPHLAMMLGAARLLALEAWSHAVQGDGVGAVEAVRDGFWIGGCCLGDGLLIGYLVSMACDSLTLNWAGATLAKLDPVALPPAELEALSREVAARRAEIRPAFLRAIDVERLAMGAWAFEGILSGRLDPALVFAVARNEGSPSLGTLQTMAVRACVWMGRPLVKADYRAYLRLMLEFRRLAEKTCSAAAVDEASRLIGKVPGYAVLTRLSAPAFHVCLSKAAEYEAMLGVARVGLAVETHRVTTGAYPGRLADVPGAAALATDPFSGSETIYRTTDKGCRVYSVGLDGKDNGGTRRGGGAKEYDIVWEAAR